MPYTMTKVGDKWQVATPNRVTAKATSERNAKAQIRLLNAVEHNPDFKPNMSKKPAGERKRKLKPRLLGD